LEEEKRQGRAGTLAVPLKDCTGEKPENLTLLFDRE